MASVVKTSSPSSPSASGSPDSGSTISTRKWSSCTWRPSRASMHSAATPGPAHLRQAVEVHRAQAGQPPLDLARASPPSTARRRTGRARAAATPGRCLRPRTACAITSAYEGVATSTCAPRSCSSIAWRAVIPPETGTTGHADPLRALMEAVAAREQPVACSRCGRASRAERRRASCSAPSARSTPRDRRACSRRRSACRGCRSTRAARTSCSTGTRSSPNGYASRSVDLPRERQLARHRPATPTSTPKVARSRASCSARSSSRGSCSAGSQITVSGGAHGLPVLLEVLDERRAEVAVRLLAAERRHVLAGRSRAARRRPAARAGCRRR